MTNFIIARRVAVAIAIVGLAAVPYAIKEVYYVNIASQILLYAIFALGLNILVGYAGLVSLGRDHIGTEVSSVTVELPLFALHPFGYELWI